MASENAKSEENFAISTQRIEGEAIFLLLLFCSVSFNLIKNRNEIQSQSKRREEQVSISIKGRISTQFERNFGFFFF